MNTSLIERQNLLLDLLSTHREVDSRAITQMEMSDWNHLMKMVDQHRLSPLLYWRIKNDRADLVIPDWVKNNLEAKFKRSTQRSLQLQREMVLIHQYLDRKNIQYVALKGAHLAYHAYPHPALRPLRDLDILIKHKDSIDVFRYLMDCGLTRDSRYKGDPQSTIETEKHFPPLNSPNSKTSVELHTKLYSPQGIADSNFNMAECHGIWDRSISVVVGSEKIPYLAPTDLLLHLIIHAVYDHKFNNGPLTMFDLACVLDSETIDWDVFWENAEKLTIKNGCILCLKMSEYYYGEKNITWPIGFSQISKHMNHIVVISSHLTLTDLDVRSESNFEYMVGSTDSLQGLIALLTRVFFPKKNTIAAHYPVSANSISVYFFYLPWIWGIITKRIPFFLSSKAKGKLTSEKDSLMQLNTWLKSQG